MKVAIAPCEPEAVFDLRTRWPAEALAAQGEIELVQLPEQLDVKETYTPDKRPVVTDIKNLPDMDVMVFTRVLSERLVSCIPIIQRKGIKVVVDMDDHFRHQPTMLTGGWKTNPRNNPRYNWRNFVEAATAADWLTVSTPALKTYKPGKATVVRNAIPERYLSIQVARHAVQTVGWSGSVDFHPGDLEQTYGGVARALEEENARFWVVGNPENVGSLLNMDPSPRGSGLIRHSEYPFQVASLDVGIVPLADNVYTRAKSWITPLTMSALGVWWIGSPSPEYTLFYEELLSAHESPPAALARSKGREWRREVLRALRTPQNEREEAVEATREFVRRNHTIEGQAWQRLEAWAEALA